MPSDFDDFSNRAHRDYPGGTAGQRRNRQLLQDTMQRHGFIGFPTEWWHFDLQGWEAYPPLDIPIDTLAREAPADARLGSIEHLVFVWLKRPGNIADRAALIRATKELRESTGLIESVRYGGPVPSQRPTVNDTFDLALLMRFKDRPALANFEKNPAHEKAIREVLRPLTRKASADTGPYTLGAMLYDDRPLRSACKLRLRDGYAVGVQRLDAPAPRLVGREK